MNGIADLLLQAAVEWRGRPATYEPGGLGAEGVMFTNAFAGIAFADPYGGPSLAFEYFTGLIFNASYQAVESLKDIVRSWYKVIGPVKIRAYWTKRPYEKWWHAVFSLEFGGAPQSITGIPPLPELRLEPEGAYGTEQEWGTVRFFMRLLQPEVWVMDYEIETEWLRTYDISSIAGTAYMLRSPRDNPYWKDYSFGDNVLAGFKPEILTAVRAYVENEQTVERPYPDPTATAHADNGFVFSNWAEGKFGSPVAQEVGG